MSDSVSFKDMKGCLLNITELTADPGLRAYRMKAMSDGTLWFNQYTTVWITNLQGNNLKKLSEFCIKDDGGNDYNVISLTETSAGPVLACSGRHTDDSKFGLLQVNHEGKIDCVITEGRFYQMTVGFGEYNRHTIYGLRENNIVSAYRYTESNNGNKWIHIKDIFLSTTPLPDVSPQPKQQYRRIQAKRASILVSTRTETNVIDEINFKTEKFIKRNTSAEIAENSLYMCCIDRDETVFVADVKDGGLYILENDAVSTWTKLRFRENSSTGGLKPHDVAVYKGKVLLVSKEGKVFMLDDGLGSAPAEMNVLPTLLRNAPYTASKCSL